jgi:hypothetical protein
LANYHNFNGQIAKVKLVIGDGAFIPTPENLREWISGNAKKPIQPKLEPISKAIIQEPVTFLRAEDKTDAKEFPDEFAG